MSKKIISFALACFMLIAMVSFVNAADVAGGQTTVTVSTLDKSDAVVDTTTKLNVDITIDKFNHNAVSGMVFTVEFDKDKLTLSKTLAGTVKVGNPTITEDDVGDYDYETLEDYWAENLTKKDLSPLPDVITNANTTGVLGFLYGDTGVTANFSDLWTTDSSNRLIRLQFNKKEGATGEAYVKVTQMQLTTGVADNIINTYTFEDGGVILPAAQETTKYAVSASANNADYGSVTLDANEVEEGGKVTVTATPVKGYAVASYTVNGGEDITVNSETFEIANIAADTTIVVNFKKIKVDTFVKTFPKRFYEVDSQTLTTVGLILEGDDYNAETAKAGIYADGKAFAAAPIAGETGKSYIVVGLKGVTETSKINLGTATQAYVNLGADDILGAEVTGYTDDKTYVVKDTDGDIAGFADAK